MPFKLGDRDISSDIAGIGSVLIVPCRFCPAATLAARESKPYLKPLRHLLRTPSYESYIQALKSRLESEGIGTGVFDSKLPHQFVACMWTSGQRNALAKRATRYDAAIVLGCDAAVTTVRSCLPAGYRVVPGMEVQGIMSVIPRVHFPFDISLEVAGVARALEPTGR